MESYLPTPIIDSYVEGTAEYQAITDPVDKKEHKKKERDAFLAYVFVRRSNQRMYGSLMRKWNGEFAQQRDEYHKRLEQAKDVLNQHKSDAIEEQKLMNKVAAKSGQKGERRKGDENEGSETQQQDTSFAQKSNDKFCYCCGSQEHLSFDCSKKNTPKDQWYVNKMHSHLQQMAEQSSERAGTDDNPDNTRSDDNKSTTSATSARTWYSSPPPRTGEMHCQFDTEEVEYMLLQNGNRISIRDQIILDTGSTMDLFCNLYLLEGDPYIADRPIEMATNAGHKVHRYQGRVPGFPEPVWYDPMALTNIMSLKTLRKHHNIAYDAAEDKFIVSLNGVAVAIFKSNDKGLYVYTPKFRRGCDNDNVQCHHHRSDDPDNEGMNFLETVRENACFYTRRQLQDAKRARELYHILGAPSVPMYKSMLRMNVIKNCPVTTEHVDIAEKIFGTDVSTLKGKTTRKTPPRVLSDTVDVPKELYLLNQKLELCIDGMFVNKRAFITSVDKTIRFRCAITVPTTSDEELFNAIDAILRQYNAAGFTITLIHSDRQLERIFDQVKDDLNVTMNYVPAQAHVPEAERNNRTLKERIRVGFYRLPYFDG